MESLLPGQITGRPDAPVAFETDWAGSANASTSQLKGQVVTHHVMHKSTDDLI